MSLKAKIEAIIYAAEAPLPMEVVEIDSQSTESEKTLSDAKQEAKQQRERSRRRVREVLEELAKEYDLPEHGMEIRQVAGGYRMSTKPEHHDIVRSFAKSLKPPIRLSLQAL